MKTKRLLQAAALVAAALVAPDASAQERCVVHIEGPASMFVGKMEVNVSTRTPGIMQSVSVRAEGSTAFCAQGWALADRALDVQSAIVKREFGQRDPEASGTIYTAYRVRWGGTGYFTLELPDGRVKAFYTPDFYLRLRSKPDVLYGYLYKLPNGNQAFCDTVNDVSSYSNLADKRAIELPNERRYTR